MQTLKTYPNGIRWVHEKLDSPAFSIQFRIMVGSFDEEKGEEGLSHFLEHMHFKSTKNQTTHQFKKTLVRLGDISNAFTNFTHTRFVCSTLNSNYETAIAIFSDQIVNALIDEQEMDIEKRVICSEIDRAHDNFGTLNYSNLVGIYFGIPWNYDMILGRKENILAYTREDLINFKNKNYTPDRIIVSTAGGVDAKDVQKSLEEHLINCFKGSHKPQNYQCKQRDIIPSQRFAFQAKETEQSYCSIGYKGLNWSNPDSAKYGLLNNIVGSGFNSRLVRKVRDKLGLVYEIGVGYSNFKESGMSSISFKCNSANLEKSLFAVKECIDEIVDDGFSQEELEIAQARDLTLLAINYMHPKFHVDSNIHDVVCENKMYNFEEEKDKINSVTIEDINKLARDIYTNQSLAVSIISKKDTLDPISILTGGKMTR